jgi:Uma2 family endonuclease
MQAIGYDGEGARMTEDRSIAHEDRLITGEELQAQVGLDSCELVEGKVVPMTPAGGEHGGCEGNFGFHLRSFVGPRKMGRSMVGEVGIYTRRNPDTVRAADVLFISNERYARQKSKGGFLEVAPDLVVEILSPSDSFGEIMRKVREHFACGVRLIWIADPASRTVSAYRSPTEVREFGPDDDLSGDDVLPGFSVKVAILFE